MSDYPRHNTQTGPAWGPEADPVAQQPRARGGLFPFPHRNFRTRGGTQVSVGGCCLPLPLGCLTTVATVGVVAARAIARTR